MSKGDKVMLTMRVGDASRDFLIEADKDGRKLVVKRGKKITTIQVQTRYGGVVRKVEVDPAMVLVLDHTATENRGKVRPKPRQTVLQLGETNGSESKGGGS
jgi:hypothetical protein